MSAAWVEASVAECLAPIRVTAKTTIPARAYKSSGRFPVIDQGQQRIAGWTDDERAVIEEHLPLIVFGDHTRAFKFADRPFARGADGTQLLKPKVGIDPLFFFYACQAIDLPARGYNRHFTILKERQLSYPLDRAEQKAIGAVLKGVEGALEQQAAQWSNALCLKRAAMGELFRRGLRGEEQKEAEIGLIPASWAVSSIGAVALRVQYGLSRRGQSHGMHPILRMNCQQDGRVSFDDMQYVDLDDQTYVTFQLRDGDLLFNRTNSIEHVGRTAIYEGGRDAVFASYLIRLTVDQERCLPRFLNYYMNWPAVQADIKKLASRAVGQANINATKLRGVPFPLPPNLDEQREIVAILDAIDRKIDLHRRKRAVLDALFKSLLHKLVTGEISVHDLDLSVLDRTPAAAEAAPA